MAARNILNEPEYQQEAGEYLDVNHLINEADYGVESEEEYFDQFANTTPLENPQIPSDKVSDHQSSKNPKNHLNAMNALNNLVNVHYERIRSKEKSARAITEQAMDQSTRNIIYKLLCDGFISEINDCLSTGKEANIYHASSAERHYAIKVYKTPDLICRNLDRYISGDSKLKNGHHAPNPAWAEKEMQNLLRMHSNGLNVPEPILLHSNVFVMSLVGENGSPAQKLKDVELDQAKAGEIYREVLIIVWKMYNKCKLVHSDLSELNLLYLKGKVYVIDVSQSVELDHPYAWDFLRKDCTNVSEFFNKCGVATIEIDVLLVDFITNPAINEGNLEEYLEALVGAAARRIKMKSLKEVEDELFDDLEYDYEYDETSQSEDDEDE